MEDTESMPAVSAIDVDPSANDLKEQSSATLIDNIPEPTGKADNTCIASEKNQEAEKQSKSGNPASEKHNEPPAVKQNNGKQADGINKKTSREEKYSRRKDERSVEQVLRALNGLESPQDKLTALCKKYADIIDENRKLQAQVKNVERRLGQVEREKDSAQSEYSKAVLTRSRLEGLCRELQRQNKAIKDESLLRIREEEEKRKEVSNKFQTTLAEITTLMQQNNEKNTKLRDYNIEMTTKLKSVCEQYELRVQQVEKISKQMKLEAQLADAKLAKAKMEAAAEKEVLLREKQELLVELAQYQARCQELQQTEIDLRSQIELYTSKYDEFQNALSRSNQVFGGFKGEMDKMSKKIVKLEKETSTWKSRWEKSHQALLEMAADKQQRDAELALANRQSTQLHKLCRTLTEERAKLMSQINSNNAAVDPDKKEKEAADLAEDRRKLNETLDNLQAVLLERELLVKQQQLEKQQQELKEELQKQQKSVQQEDTPCNAQSGIKVNDKKKGKKQKNSRQTEEKSISPVCKAQIPTLNTHPSSPKTPPNEIANETSASVVNADTCTSVVQEPSKTLAETQPSEESPKVSENIEDELDASTLDDAMPLLESCETLASCESVEASKAEDVPLPVEPIVEQNSIADSVATTVPFSYAAALGSKVHDNTVAMVPVDKKLTETEVAPPPSNNLKDEKVVEEIVTSLSEVAQSVEVSQETVPFKDGPMIDASQEAMNLSETSPETNTSTVNTDGSSGEQHCVQNASPVSKKGKENAKRKKK